LRKKKQITSFQKIELEISIEMYVVNRQEHKEGCRRGASYLKMEAAFRTKEERQTRRGGSKKLDNENSTKNREHEGRVRFNQVAGERGK